MTHELQSALRKIIEGYKFQCTTIWEDDNGYRSMPKSAQELFRDLIGREVDLDEFYVSTGGYCDGQATMTRALVDEAMTRITA